MRSNNKYKIYNQSGNIPESFHQRILNFKRPKWKRIQKIISKKNYSQKFLINNLRVKKRYKNWDKIETYFTQGLKSKNAVFNYFDNALGIKHLEKSLRNSNNYLILETLLSCLIKPEFRIDILLARLGFFCTSYQARQSINSQSVRVNNKAVCGNFFLRKGDVITLLDSLRVTVSKSFRCFSPSKKVFTFIEVDYYSNTIVIIKNLNELQLEDMHLLSLNPYDLKKIKDFL
jgi:ribosomal protein S4